MKSDFDRFPWLDDADLRSAWQRGMTGYPIVDAGMRELYTTGYMHNRVRMIVASFLIKNLMQDWRHGEKWFWDCLVDADLASNSCSWQWVAGSGADAAPYFRIFNPVTQSQKFDPDGSYIRHFVPELAKLSAKHLHDPSSAPTMELELAGIELGRDYPAAIVDLKQTRERALAAYKTLRD
jgi:deoxyribodipyrimidine photo-lyase